MLVAPPVWGNRLEEAKGSVGQPCGRIIKVLVHSSYSGKDRGVILECVLIEYVLSSLYPDSTFKVENGFACLISVLN